MLDSDVYVDSEEDEVFFGNFNEKEKKIGLECQDKLDLKSEFNNVLNNLEDNYIYNKERLDREFVENEKKESTNFSKLTTLSFNETNNSPEHEEFHSIHSSNTSVELDHNYSYTKQKIDESILATPKSVVKADKDGGFLKVLSEIALVKAEADFKMEADKKTNIDVKLSVYKKKEDEDKENKISIIPEIKVTEATPENSKCISPYPNMTNAQCKKFAISYNSYSDILDGMKKIKTQSITEDEHNKNYSNKKNLLGNGNRDNLFAKKAETIKKCTKKGRKNSWSDLVGASNESTDILNFADDSLIEDAAEETFNCKNYSSVVYPLEQQNESVDKNEIVLVEVNSSSVVRDPDMKTISTSNQSYNTNLIKNMQASSITEQENLNSKKNNNLNNSDVSPVFQKTKKNFTFIEPVDIHLKKAKEEAVITSSKALMFEEVRKNNLKTNNAEDSDIDKGKAEENNFLLKTKAADTPIISKSFEKTRNISEKYRFSKEARKIVEALKICSVNDTLNLTIPDINVEEMENSFLSPEPPVPSFDATILDKNDHLIKSMRPSKRLVVDESKQCEINTINNENISKTPEANFKTIKYFSDKKVCSGNLPNSTKKCVKRLQTPYNNKIPLKNVQSSEKKIETKIPVFKSKPTKIPSICLTGKNKMQGPNITPYKRSDDEDAKINSCRTNSGNYSKTTKFKNVVSPISAYIHNKPTALVVNVKPQTKNNGFLSGMKNSLNGDIKEKSAKTPKKELKLPFVEYKSAIPFKIEKRPENHLPRLTPAVERLIGTNSPRILKHKGRFYVKTPSKNDLENGDSTIMADKNEVSVVVSQVAQKSSSLKK